MAFFKIIDQKTLITEEESSFCFLVNKDLSHSEKIRLGFGPEGIEKALIRHTEDLTSYKNIKPANSKGNKEFDFLFESEQKKEIIYAEIKTNLNLDTEKIKATALKCKNNALKLKKDYPDHEIRWVPVGNLGARY